MFFIFKDPWLLFCLSSGFVMVFRWVLGSLGVDVLGCLGCLDVREGFSCIGRKALFVEAPCSSWNFESFSTSPCWGQVETRQFDVFLFRPSHHVEGRNMLQGLQRYRALAGGS